MYKCFSLRSLEIHLFEVQSPECSSLEKLVSGTLFVVYPLVLKQFEAITNVADPSRLY